MPIRRKNILNYTRFFAALLVAILSVFAFCGCSQKDSGNNGDAAGEEEIRAELLEKINDEIDAASAALREQLRTGDTFTYKDEEYSLMNAMQVANDVFWGTEDYYPFCDAYYSASIEKSERVGEVYLTYVAAYNKYAVAHGYANYYEMASKDFNYDFSPEQLFDVVKTYYPKTVENLHYYTAALSEVSHDVDFDKAATTNAICTAYGKIDSKYENDIRALLAGDKYSDETTDNVGEPNGYVNTVYSGETGEKTVSLYLLYGDVVTYSMLLEHELGHYLYAINKHGASDRFLALSETHSIGGFILTLDNVETYLKGVYGEQEGAFMALCALMKQLSFLYQATVANVLEKDVFVNPQNYTGADFARKYFQINEELGIDCGYSEAYELLMGSDWYDSFGLNVSEPFYKLSYAVGSINAIWLAKQHSDDGSGYEKYRKLIETPITKDNYRDVCTEVGLPYILDASMHKGLDDYFSTKLDERIAVIFPE